MSDSVRPHRRQPTRLPHPWDSPGKNTGLGFHFLLQCKKVKSESEDAQSCLTLCDPMNCSLPGSSVHGIFQARILEWVAITGKGLYLNKFCGTTNFPRSPCVRSLCCSVIKSYPALCNYTTPGFPVPHYLPEFAQIHVH